MILSSALFLLGSFQNSIAITIPIVQQTLLSPDSVTIMASEQQPVPGDNPAYFSGSTPPSEQLFQIEEFVLAPIPPPMYVAPI